MSKDKELVIITNKYDGKCSQCGRGMEKGEGLQY